MEIDIEIFEARNGRPSEINLTYLQSDGTLSKAPLYVRNFVDAFDLTRDIKSVRFDLLLISILVYGIDCLLNREVYSFDGWAREIKVNFPVYHLPLWQGKEELLMTLLNFLTGDQWDIQFKKNELNCFYKPKKGRWRSKIRNFEKEKIKSTSLFSGGLDSLIGIIDQLEILNNDDQILLVSHFDFTSPGPSADQRRLFNYLKVNEGNRVNWVQIKLGLGNKTINNDNIEKDSNYRSRSLFFMGLGCYLTQSNNLIVPENGTISINYPLTPSRVSSLSTRTTHPFVLDKMQILLSNLGIKVELNNPYSFKTKGEMVSDCLNQYHLLNMFEDSVSCGKRGRKQHWEVKEGTEHCGICMPCVYRRAALNSVGEDNQLYGNRIEHALSANRFVDLPALLNYLKKGINPDQMKRDILVNGSIPIRDLTEYAEMVIRSRQEVLKLFQEKGNRFIKSELNLL